MKTTKKSCLSLALSADAHHGIQIDGEKQPSISNMAMAQAAVSFRGITVHDRQTSDSGSMLLWKLAIE
jgi:hypothetical protein